MTDYIGAASLGNYCTFYSPYTLLRESSQVVTLAADSSIRRSYAALHGTGLQWVPGLSFCGGLLCWEGVGFRVYVLGFRLRFQV